MHGDIFIDDAINWDWSPNRGLVSRWMCLPDQQRGVKWRDLCKRNHGTLTNMDPATAWSPKLHTGGYGSISNESDNGYIACSSLPRVALTCTFSAWFYRIGTGYNSYADALISQWGALASESAFNFGVYGTRRVRILISDGSGASEYGGTGSTFENGVWNHLACTVNGTELACYINGNNSFTGTSARTINQSPTYSLQLGAEDSLWYPNGYYDDLRIINRVLSAAEVRDLYEDSLAGSPQSLNWYSRKTYSVQEAADGGNRRRRCLIGAA